MTHDRDRITDPEPRSSDQALLEDLRRLEAALGRGVHEHLGAPDENGRESDADAA